MGSGYFGEPNLGNNEKSSYSSSSSSRKSKKSNSDKPKQPQRGLGVAQLEKIRLHTQMASTYNLPSLHNLFATNLSQQEDTKLQTPYSSISYSSSSYGFPAHQTIMTGLGDNIERANIRYGVSQPPSTTSTWHPGTVYEPQHYAQPNMTRCLLNLQVEDSLEKRRKKDSIGSTSQNSELNGSQELDLELRLSL